MRLSLDKHSTLWALVVILLLHAVALRDELTVSRRDFNDNVDHFQIVEGMVHAIEHGGNPLDWFPESPFGYPVIRDYQPLAHGLVVLLYFATGKSISLIAAFVLIRFLAIALLPLSFFAAARWMDFPPWTAVAAAALGPLIATHGLFGLEYESYVWQSHLGLFTQSVAANLLLLTLGLGFRALRRGRPLIPAGLLLSLTFICHFFYGYMGAASLCLLALIPDREVPRKTRIFRTVVVGAVAFLISLFQLLPTLWLDRGLMDPNRLAGSWKNDSLGASVVLKLLFSGELLDYGRLPVLSLLALAGAAALGWRFWKKRRLTATERFTICGFLFWLMVYFGRPTWGPLLWLLGIPHEFHLHRLIAGVQIFLVLLAAIGLCAVWRIIAAAWRPLAAAVAVAAILLVPISERLEYLDASRRNRQQHLEILASEKPSLDALVSALRKRGGNTYAGLSSNWGNLFMVAGAPLYAFLSTNDLPQTSFSYHTVELTSEMLAQFDELQPSQYRLFNVRSVVAPEPIAQHVPAFLTPRLNAGRFRVFDAPGDGYFDLVDVLASIRADDNSFFDLNNRWLHSGMVAQRAHLLLDFFGTAPGGIPHMAADGAEPEDPYSTLPGEIIGERRSGDVFQATLQAKRPAFALFRMTWHPNWKARVDGRPAATYMLSPGFIGVPVPAGAHRVLLRYQPANWRLLLACFGLLAGLLLSAAELSGLIRFPRTALEIPVEPAPGSEPEEPRKAAEADRGRRKRRQRR